MTLLHPSLTRLVLAGAIALLCALGAAQPASASHLKGGSLSTAIDADGVMTIHMKDYQRFPGCTIQGGGTFSGGVTITAPDGTTQVSSTLQLPATRCLGATILYEGDGTVNLADPDPTVGFGPNPPAGVYTVTHSSCCRVSGIVNSTTASFGLTSTVHLVAGQATGSPRYIGATSTGAARNYDYHGDVTASDPDGGTLTYGLMQKADASAPFYDTGAPDSNVVSLTGSIANVAAATTGGWTAGNTFVYKIEAIDDQGDRTDQDILVTVTDNKPPAFDALPDPYTVTAGTADSLAIGASDPDNSTTAKSDTVTISHGTLPDWASVTSTAGNPATADLAISAPVGTAGMFLVSLDAADDDPGVTLLDSKVLRVKVVPAAPDPGSEPTSTTTDTGTTVHFDAIDGATYECRLDGGAWEACTATTAITGLASGHHKFSVRQTSDVGPGGALDIEWDIAAAAVTPVVLTAVPILTAVPTASARVCVSRRDVRLHWRVRKSAKNGQIKVAINGVRRASLAPSARSFLVKLAGRTKSTVRVRISTTSRGHKMATARTYRVCGGKVARTPLRSLQLRYVH